MNATYKNSRRVSDVAFSIDAELNISDANRGFLQLLNETDGNVNLARFLDDADAAHLRTFLAHYNPKNKTHYCIISLLLTGHPLACILHVSQKTGATYTIDLQELSYAQELMERTILENREHTSLLNEFDAHFVLYEGGKFKLRNTKDMTIDIYRGDRTDFVIFFTDFFKVSAEDDGTRATLNALFDDLEAGVSGKQYRLLLGDSSSIMVKTLRSAARNSSVMQALVMQPHVRLSNNSTFSEKLDGLTELYNKKTITELATKKVNVSKTPAALFIIDVDKFKDFNDNFGHAFGDKVLVVVAKVIREAVGDMGLSGRIGGDEFMSIVDTNDEETIRNIARAIKQGIQWNMRASDPEQVVTCSIGIARAPTNRDTYDELFELADRALYIAKMRGRNCYIIYKPELHDRLLIERQQSDRNTVSGKVYMESALAEMSILGAIMHKEPGYIEKSLEMLREYMTVHKIAVYTQCGAELPWQTAYVLGKNDHDIRIDYLNSPKNDFFVYFNDYHFFHMDNINNLDTMDKKKFHMYLNDNVASTLEILWQDGERKVLVCLDIYKPARTLPRHTIVFALMTTKLISQGIFATMER